MGVYPCIYMSLKFRVVTALYANFLMIFKGNQAAIFHSFAWLKSALEEGYIF